MNAQDVITNRNLAIRELQPKRLLATGMLATDFDRTALQEMVHTINQSASLPSGLCANETHLICRAVARVLEKHAHFGQLLLPTGQVHTPQVISVGLTTNVDGVQYLSVVSDPGQRPLEKVISEYAAMEVEIERSAGRRARGAVRMRNKNAGLFFLFNNVIGSPLFAFRDRVGYLFRWTRQNVLRSGSINVINMEPLGVSRATTNLVHGESARLYLCQHDDPKRLLTLSLAFDLRLFEAFETLAFLQEIKRLLSDPLTCLA